MATREADLALGDTAKKTGGGRKSLLMMGSVLTRLDECPSLGTALPVVICHRLPAARVTDDLRPACTRDMASVATQRVHARAEQTAGGVPALAITARRVAAHA